MQIYAKIFNLQTFFKFFFDFSQKKMFFNIFGASGYRFLFKSSLYCVVGNHFFFEDVGAGFGRTLHLDDFAISAAFTLLK